LGSTTSWLTLLCWKIWSSTSANRGRPLPIQVVTLPTPSIFMTRASTRLVTSSLAAYEVPSGYHRSTSTSSRLESGKNWFCTLPMPTRPSTSVPIVIAIVSQRCCTHQFTTARKRA
jgi:hypothetical protein